MKTTRYFLLSLILFILTPITSTIPSFGYTNNAEITFVRQMPSQATPGETITIEFVFDIGDGITDPMRGFYFTDEIPEDLTVEEGSYTVKLNGVDLTNIVDEIGVAGDFYPGAIPYRLILETPPDFINNNPLEGGDKLILTYELTIPNDTTAYTVYTFPRYNWAGCIMGDPMEYVFGYKGLPDNTLTVLPSVAIPILNQWGLIIFITVFMGVGVMILYRRTIA